MRAILRVTRRRALSCASSSTPRRVAPLASAPPASPSPSSSRAPFSTWGPIVAARYETWERTRDGAPRGGGGGGGARASRRDAARDAASSDAASRRVETALLRRDSRGADEILAALNTEDARRADALRVLSRAVRALEHSAQDATAAAATPSSRIALERHPGFASALTRCVAAAEAIAAREDDDGALDWSARASVAAAMHGIAKLHRARRVDALSRGRSGSGSGSTSATTPATVADTWRALVRATRKLSDGLNAKQATDVAWALAVVASDASASTTRTRAQTATDRVELAEAWRAIEDATARAPATRAKHASVATWAAAKMQSALGEPPSPRFFDALARRIVDVSPAFDARNVANTLWGIGKIAKAHPAIAARAPRETMDALYVAAARVAPRLSPQEVANAVYGAGFAPRPSATAGDPAIVALDVAIARCAREMKPQEVVNALQGIATGRAGIARPADADLRTALKKTAADDAFRDAWRELDAAVRRRAHRMSLLEVGIAMWSYATLRASRASGDAPSPTRGAFLALERRLAMTLATARFGDAKRRDETSVATATWAYHAMETRPSDDAARALDAALAKAAATLPAQETAMTLIGVASTGTWRAFDSKKKKKTTTTTTTTTMTTWDALVENARRRVHEMKPIELAYATWAVAIVSFVDETTPPSRAFFETAWARAATLTPGVDFPEGKRGKDALANFYHAYLMRRDAVDDAPPSAVPAWLHADARDAWRAQAKNDVNASAFHDNVARDCESLGLTAEKEALAEDGNFSADVLLRDHDAIVECDGPNHFYVDYQRPEPLGADANPNPGKYDTRKESRVRKVKTEARDKFLRARFTRVIVVPWFDVHGMQPAQRTAYVRARLEDAGVLKKDAALE